MFFGVLTLLTLVGVTGCGGGSSNGSNVGLSTVPDLYLESLVVEAGGQTLEFDSSKLGPYELNVSFDADEVAITAIPVLSSARVFISEMARTDFGQVITDNEKEVGSGQLDTRAINDGDNTYIVSVWDSNRVYKIEYLVRVHRVSTEASLARLALEGLRVNDGAFEVNGGIDQNLNFDSATADYELTVINPFCAVNLSALPTERNSRILVDGVRYIPNVDRYIPLPNIGADTPNVIEIAIESEEQSEEGRQTENYTVSVVRSEPTAAELEAEAGLFSFELEASLAPTNWFTCGHEKALASVSRDTESSNIILHPVAGVASILLSKYQVDEDGEIAKDADSNSLYHFEDVAVVPSEAFLLTYEPGNNLYVIKVTSENGENSHSYDLTIDRKSTNWIIVDSAETLQSTLMSAQPGDEILVTEGEYFGNTATSGNLQSHFYSAVSGTAENPIVLRGSITSEAQLLGNGTPGNAVLRLDGNYWTVSDLYFQNSGHGIILDSASNNKVEYVDVSDTTQSAISIRNGSHDNIVRLSRISSSEYGVVIGSEGAEWTTAPVPGLFESSNTGLQLRYNNFGRDIRSEHVVVNEGAENISIWGNIFDTELLSGERNSGSVISVSGNDVKISFNDFDNGEANVPADLVIVDDAVADWHVNAWGEGVFVYENSMSYPGAQGNFVNNISSADLNVYSNSISGADGITILNAGLAFDGTDQTKAYQFQSVENPELCLAINNFTFGSAVIPAVAYDVCDVSPTNTWVLRHAFDGSIYIQALLYHPSRFMLDPFFGNGSTTMVEGDAFLTFIDIDSIPDLAALTTNRWVLREEGNGLVIRNSLNLGSAISPVSVAETVAAGTRATLRIDRNLDIQRFNLIEVAPQ